MQSEPDASSAPLADELARLGQEFLTGFLEAEVGRYPDNVQALAELSLAYSRLQRHEEALAIDRRLVRLVPEDATAHYNLACSLALLDCGDEALDALESAVSRGYDDAEFMERDDDLASLREEPRFRELVNRLTARS